LSAAAGGLDGAGEATIAGRIDELGVPAGVDGLLYAGLAPEQKIVLHQRSQLIMQVESSSFFNNQQEMKMLMSLIDWVFVDDGCSSSNGRTNARTLVG
jgi:hypothetical protein